MSDQLLSVTEAAKRMRVSRQWVHELIDRNEIQAELVGAQYVIRESEVKRWLRIRKDESNDKK